MDELIHVKHLEQCLILGKCSMNIIYIVFYDFVDGDVETQRGPTAGD